MNGSRAFLKYLMCIWICGGILTGSGCRFPWQPQSGESAARPSPLLMMQYDQAVMAYQAKEYDVAAKRFESVQEKAGGGELSRSALFGLACARLMAAETPSQHHEAIVLWESWVKRAPKNFKKENPMLMVPLVKEKMLFSNIPLTSDGEGDIEANPKVSQWLVIHAAEEIKRLRAKIESVDRSDRKLKNRNVLLQKQIAKLKQKIKALETIDQKIQKKKSAIPSSDSTTTR